MVRPTRMLNQITLSINAMFVLWVVLWPRTSAAHEHITPVLVQTLKTSVASLEAVLKTLKEDKTVQARDLRLARSEVDQITEVLDRYFHGKNQRNKNTRPVVLTLRKEILKLQALPNPLLQTRHGVIHFARRVHWTLAHAFLRNGDKGQCQIHLRRILEAIPNDLAAHEMLTTLVQTDTSPTSRK